MSNSKGASRRLSLMDLPAETRLQIISHIEDSTLPRNINIAQNCIHRIEPSGCPTLAALSRTSKALHAELSDALYRNRQFNIEILTSDSLLILWRRNFSPTLDFMARMQSVHLSITLNTASTKISQVCERLRRVLGILERSVELRVLQVRVREVFHLAVKHDFANGELQLLRREVVEKGLREGKSEKQIELDFGWKVLEFFANGLRVWREGSPCCGKHALHWKQEGSG